MTGSFACSKRTPARTACGSIRGHGSSRHAEPDESGRVGLTRPGDACDWRIVGGWRWGSGCRVRSPGSRVAWRRVWLRPSNGGSSVARVSWRCSRPPWVTTIRVSRCSTCTGREASARRCCWASSPVWPTPRGCRPCAVDGRAVEPSASGFLVALGEAMGLAGGASAVAALAERSRCVLLIDTYEQLSPLDGWLRSSFLPDLPEGTIVVIAGRQPPDAAWRTDPGWSELARIVSLRNLPPDDSRAYLCARDVPDDHHERCSSSLTAIRWRWRWSPTCTRGAASRPRSGRRRRPTWCACSSTVSSSRCRPSPTAGPSRSVPAPG